MGKKHVSICKWSSGDVDANLDELWKMVREPRFACKSCGRVAKKKKWLCKPTRLREGC